MPGRPEIQWIGKTVRLSDREGSPVGIVDSAANGYYLIRMRVKERGSVKVLPSCQHMH